MDQINLTPLATDPSAPVTSFAPVVLGAPERGDDIQLRVTAPATGKRLPVIVFSHGFGQSMDSYAPLVAHWAASGFAVISPTHLDSRTLSLAPDDPRTSRIWRFRVEDLTRVIDELETIESTVPGLGGRLDRDRIAVAGHSWGATSASALLGARVVSSDGASEEDLSDPRVSAAVLLAVAGLGGGDLTPFAAENFSFMNPSFGAMASPALIVAGDADQSMLSTRGPDWWSDAYRLSPGEKSLLTLFGAEHSLGGISGYIAAETTDESPERVALIRKLTTAYLRRALGGDDAEWAASQSALLTQSEPLGRLDSR